MPTNLKNLLSRSRSRNDLKSSNKKDSEKDKGSEDSPQTPSSSPLQSECSCNNSSCPNGNGQRMRKDSSSRSLFSLPGIEPAATPSRPSSPEQQSSRSPAAVARSRSMRKCETVLALSSYHNSTNTKKGMNMKDRILSTSSSAINSLLHTSSKTTTKLFGGLKCSSGSPSQSNACLPHPAPGGGGLEASTGSQSSIQQPPLTPMNRLRRNSSVKMPYSRAGSLASLSGKCGSSSGVEMEKSDEIISCRLCLSNIKVGETLGLEACSCRYCKDCVQEYVTFEITEGAYEIACPDATCPKQGILTLPEIQRLVPALLLEKHQKFRLYKEVESDKELMWCPSPGCETVCTIVTSETNGTSPKIPTIQCSRCQHVFCSECKLPSHPNLTCDYYRQKLIHQGKLSIIEEEPFAAYDSIKKCPFCHVPIEKDSGCAQMMCKRCKHVFCWYCLTSLDDDFLLRHYDKGPCKNKLGHSRASVVWHRTQVIGIFAGFGLLVLLASPLLILAAPCLLCCRCRYCTDHLDSDDSPELL